MTTEQNMEHFPVIEAHLERDYCCRKKFILSYSNKWKKIIPKDRYKSDLSDINEVYRKNLPYTLVYLCIFLGIIGIGAFLMWFGIVHEKKKFEDLKSEGILKAALFILISAVVVYMFLSFRGACKSRSAQRKMRYMVKDINEERWYRSKDIQWEVMPPKGEPKYVKLVAGNKAKKVKKKSKRREVDPEVLKIKEKYLAKNAENDVKINIGSNTDSDDDTSSDTAYQL